MRQARPLGSGERVNVDRAPASELVRLPKVGPRLAKVIVADREARGSFGNLAGLDRVSGIGPGLLRLLAPHVAFSGVPRGSSPVEDPGQPPAPLDLNTVSITELDALPGVGPTRAAATTSPSSS